MSETQRLSRVFRRLRHRPKQYWVSWAVYGRLILELQAVIGEDRRPLEAGWVYGHNVLLLGVPVRPIA